RLHVGVRRRRVEVVVALLHVLAVVALRAREAEETLLQDRVPAVPERDREAHVLVTVGEAHQAVLAPAVCARPGVLVRKGVPRSTVRAVVLADRSPLALRKVWAPALPILFALAVLFEADALGIEGLCGHGRASRMPGASILESRASSWGARTARSR